MSDQLTDLEHTIADVHRELMPTLSAYGELAKRAVDAQRAWFLAKMVQQYPSAAFSEQPKVMTVQATESLPKLKAAIAQLVEAKVEVTGVVYDPVRHEFLIFA